MLLSLSIRNIILIDMLDIQLAPGLCVLTGETGAGKSILLDALGFVLGDRSTGRLLRHGESKGSVTACFSIKNNMAIQNKLHELDIPENDEDIIIRRSIDAGGKSRAYVNDTPVNVQTLKDIGEHLLEIHGQHDQGGLLSSTVHRQILDEYGRLQPLLQKTAESYHHYKHLADLIEAKQRNKAEAAREEDYLRFVINELEKLNPKVGEEEVLAEKRSQLMHREKMQESITRALSALAGEQDVVSAIRSAQMALDSIREHFQSIEDAAEMLERSAIEIGEVVSALEHAGSDDDEADVPLEQVEERLFALRAAARKYGVEVEGLSDYLINVKETYALLSDENGDLEQLQRDCQKAKDAYKKEAGQLHEARVKSSQLLEKRVMEELAQLKMQQTRFQVEIQPLAEENWSEAGMDKVQYIASTNPGTPLQPIAKIASGGELSRFMLAFKVALSHVKSVGTLVFDEVDTGIGGAVADSVGKRLEMLGQRAQVLVVTHQPQVASKGGYHLKVSKLEIDGMAVTRVQPLAEQERREELARMLAGEIITNEARAAASKLLQAEEV